MRNWVFHNPIMSPWTRTPPPIKMSGREAEGDQAVRPRLSYIICVCSGEGRQVLPFTETQASNIHPGDPDGGFLFPPVPEWWTSIPRMVLTHATAATCYRLALGHAGVLALRPSGLIFAES